MTIYIDKTTSLMTKGGDARIRLDPSTGLNLYHSAPFPGPVLAYASSTANDISPAAFTHVERLLAETGRVRSGPDYARRLEKLRHRLRRAYGLGEDVEVVFAPSGTDLEYVALACVAGGPSGTLNLLLGADEVGSGCIHSAKGDYFARSTALGIATSPGKPVPGLIAIDLGLIEVRDEQGRVRPSMEISSQIEAGIECGLEAGRNVLVHVVHGSKTGLILPSAPDLDRIQTRFGKAATLVVDACQARITSRALSDYLRRGAIIFVTGSKFMGAPPFSGFAFVPRELAQKAPSIPEGLATIFRRAEWPAGWPGAGHLPDSANPGLLLRLEAALFELERFQALPVQKVEQVILAFHEAIRAEIIDRAPVRRLAPYPPGDRIEADTHPIEMRTLSTLDLSSLGGATFEQAQGWHRALLAHQVRLGQPVKCVRLEGADGRAGDWGATLRIGLAMWQIVERAGLSNQQLETGFQSDMARIRTALLAVAG